MVYDIAKRKDDEYMTPEYAVRPLLKYLKPCSCIWCPFDKGDSNFVKVLSEIGTVISTHIDDGTDFLDDNCGIDTEMIDYIVSNPPYSKKVDVLEKLFRLDIPFAMLVGEAGLFDGKRKFEMFKRNKFELLIPSKRIDYLDSKGDKKGCGSTPYKSIYVCHNILPKQIVFEEIDKK